MNAFNDKNKFLIYLTLIALPFLIALLAVKNIKISPDAMRFGLVSQQILDGNGIRVPIMRLEDHYIPVNGTIPFLDQMPLLPILFALLGGVSSQNLLPAQIINVISNVAISVLTFLVMRNIFGCNQWFALLTSVLVSFSLPLLWLTNHICSDLLFIAFVAASLYLVMLSRKNDYHRFNRNILTAGIIASLAVLTRNAGIALIPVMLWEVFIFARYKKHKSKYLSTIIAMVLPLMTIGAMFLRNLIVSGSLRGFNEPIPERSYMEAFTGTLEMIFKQFQLGTNGIFFILLFSMLFIIYLIINAQLREQILTYFKTGLDSILVFMLSYAMLIVLTMATQQWRFELRYVSPLVPFLFMTFIIMILSAIESIKLQKLYKLSLCGIILFLSIITFSNFYKSFLNLSELLNKQEKAYSILNSCTYNWLTSSYKRDTIIATNRPFHLSFFGGYSAIALPHKRFNPGIQVADDMASVLPERMSKLGSQVIALFEAAEEQYEGDYITRLFNNRKTNDKFVLVHECSDGVVYELRQ
jgi:hypothetical protein